MLRRPFYLQSMGLSAPPVNSDMTETLFYSPEDADYFQDNPQGRFNRYLARHSEERSRFSSLLDFSMLRFRCLVVGAGAGGRQTCMLLATMGIPFTVVDFDTVEAANIGTQGFRTTDIGKPKAQAVAEEANRIYGPTWRIAEHFNGRIEDYPGWKPVVFLCVDSMEVRRTIVERCEGNSMLYIDSRMGAMTMDIYVVDRPALHRQWLESWYPSSDAYEAPCTAKTTYFVSNISAGWRVSAFARWLTERDTPHTLHYSLIDEMHTTRFDPPAVNPS